MFCRSAWCVCVWGKLTRVWMTEKQKAPNMLGSGDLSMGGIVFCGASTFLLETRGAPSMIDLKTAYECQLDMESCRQPTWDLLNFNISGRGS